MYFYSFKFASYNAPYMFAVRLRHRQVNNLGVNLKCVVATPREIDELIRNYKCPGFNRFSETAYYACTDHVLHAKRFQRSKICFVWNFVRWNRMLETMSRQKSDTPAAQFANAD